MSAPRDVSGGDQTNAKLALATEFLQTVLPVLRPGEVYRCEGWPTPNPFADNFLNVPALAKFVVQHGLTSNMYFTPVAFLTAGKGRKAEAVSRAVAVWSDLDCGTDKPFATREEALDCIDHFLLKPRYIVSSGRGIHVYWLLAEDVEAEGFGEFMAIVRGVAEKLGGDPKACLRTQLMRIPGTTNIDSKAQKKDGHDYPVELLADNRDAPEYSLSDFEEAGVTPKPEPLHEERELRSEGGYPDADFNRVLAGCGWMEHCRDDAATLPEGEWYAMLSIAGRCTDGQSWAHELSKPHAKYNPRETDAKLAHALEDAGPRTCANIESEQGGRPYCEVCPLRGLITSPIVAGHRDRYVSENASSTTNMSLVRAIAYPVEALPEPVRAFVEEAAAAMGVPPDLVGPHLVALAGGVLGRNVRITIKRGSWIEYPAIWSCLVANAGTTKSPALNASMKGVSWLQNRANDVFDDHYRDYEDDLAQWEATPLARRGAKPVPPILRHFYTTDVTPEALAPMLLTSPGLTITADELVGWVKGMDAYKSGKGKERQTHLQLWAGQDLKVDRKGQKSLLISHPVICVVGGVQPGTLSSLSGDLLQADGFLDRFLWSVPPTVTAYWTEKDISQLTNAAVEDLFANLADLYGEFCFGVDARNLWAEWYNSNADSTAAESGIMRGVDSKMPRQLARVVLVLHCLQHPVQPKNEIDVATLKAAISIIEYHRQHAREALSSLGGFGRKSTSLRNRIMQLLADGVSSVSSHRGEEGTNYRGPLSMQWWTRSELHEALGGRVKADALEETIVELEVDGFIERQLVKPDGPKGGRPSEQIRLVTLRRN